MPVKRRVPKERLTLPPEAYAAFEAGDEKALRAAIGQKPWEDSPLEAPLLVQRRVQGGDLAQSARHPARVDAWPAGEGCRFV